MQKDSLNISTPGPVTLNQVNNQESPIKSLQCSQCTLCFKSKAYLFEHLNKVHGMDVDSALRDSGLKSSGNNKVNTDNNSNRSGDDLRCKRCDFNTSSLDVLNEHEHQCQLEDLNMIGDLNAAENLETNTTVISTNQHSEALTAKENSSVHCFVPTTNSKSILNSSKDLTTSKRPLQTITKYFAASSESNGKPPVKLADSSKLIDSTKGTIILQESPSSSSPNSSGVFKVTAMHSVIDNADFSNQFLRNDHVKNTDLRPPKPKEQPSEKVPDHVNKRTNSESSKCPPAKRVKIDKDETKQPKEANESQHQPSSNTDSSFKSREDEGEKKQCLVNGDTKMSEFYFCKHCDFSDVGMTPVSTHYQSDHPYVRYTPAYIQDPSNGSATFRCLHCPVEFGSVADLQRHYTENHPEAPNIFTMQSHELNLVHRCFVCPFTTNVLKAIKKHYKENHPTHKVENSLIYYRFIATRCQEGSSHLKTCEKALSSERPSPDSDCIPCKEIKNAPSPQHPTSTGTEMVLYNCNNCDFSHKSVIVMHVHYQKCHPGEEITIEKIKQLACVTSTSQTAETCPNSVKMSEKSASQTNISDFFKKTKDKADLSQRDHAPEACKSYSETPKPKEESTADKSKGKKSPTTQDREMPTKMDSLSSSSPDKFFYCQLCSYSSTKIKSVVGHHNAKHAMHSITCIEEILLHSAKVQKKLKSEAEASASSTSADSETRKPVEDCSKNEFQQQEDEASDSSVMEYNPYACAENLFYCQECNYGNPAVNGVANHQNQVHRNLLYSRERIMDHTALMREEIEKSKSQPMELSFSTRLPLPFMNDGDKDMFFCHFCNYRQNSVDYVLKHYIKKHRGFTVKAEQVRLYTSMVREKTQKLHKKTSANREVNHASLGGKGNEKEKTKKHGKSTSTSAPLSMTASQTQRNLQCYRCPYSTQYVYMLKRHIWKIHRANRSVTEVLRLCFRQGNIQAGYHCDVCVFSHKKAAAVYRHYQEQHPARGISLKHVTTRLFIGPEARPPKRKKSQINYTDGLSDSDGTDGSLSSQRSGQNETKTYSCRACPFKGNSVSVITRHYRAVHPWSVKEDGSVLDVVSKSTTNRLDNDDMPGSFESYQEPLEFDNSPGSPHEATVSSKSPTKLCCPYCPAKFDTQHGLNVHCGMKHQQAVNSDEQKQQVQTRMHVFKCPHCTYLNTSHQGVLTHCQMKHPALDSRAESLHVDQAQLDNWGESFKVKEPGDKLKLRGYMCETCLQIFSTLERLNKHSEMDHADQTVANAVQNRIKPQLKPSAVSKIKQFRTLLNRGSVSQVSFLSKKIYAVVRCQYCSYTCSTKIALERHVRVHHKNVSISKIQDCVLKCSLCTKTYFKKKRLGSHYIKKHGKESFFKYFVPVYKQSHEKPFPTSHNHPLTPQPESMHEGCKTGMTMEEKKQSLFYRCPSCSYVNASYHGTLTHCQMQHPDIVARADELQTVEIPESNMVNCSIGKGSNARGFMCKKCPLIYASLKKLNIHCERDHNQASPTSREHSAYTESGKQPVHGPWSLALRAFKNQTSAMSTTEMGQSVSHQFGTPETCQSNKVTVQNAQKLYKCHICSYKGIFRRYLQVHYKNTHKLDPFTTHKLLEKYNKCKPKKARQLPEAEAEAEPEERPSNKCKKCPELMFDSSQLLVAHYSNVHSSDGIVDFTVLSQGSKKGSTGLYRCVHCKKQMNGIRKLWYHLDCHRETAKKKAAAERTTTPPVIPTTPETKSFKVCRQEEVVQLESMEELTNQWNATQVQTFAWPLSPLPSPTGLKQPELEPKEAKHTCKHCRRSFMSLKGLRAHERSHAAIKKLNNLSTSVLKHNIDKYVLFKSGTIKPFLCSFCSYRTTLMGLWRSHFMRTHHDVIADLAETDNHHEEPNDWPESDEEPEKNETSLYLEPPDVQRQLNHYSLMAQADAASKTIVEQTRLPDSLHHCEFCNFSSEHLSSVRRHYLNRHGKKILRCKDCNFFTGLRKTLEVHMETGHSTYQSEPTHHKDLRCPFCLYQTKNKNNMIDHIVLHREERVVPIEVRRSKLSRYLEGIVFRCHKCTFTSGSADSLRTHMTKHDDIKPYKCRLCYFDCPRLNDLEAHLSDKHQVVRNHELVGQVSLDQLQARAGRTPEEEEGCSSNLEDNNDSEDVETEEFVTDCDEEFQTKEANQKQEQDGKNEESPAESSVLDLQNENAKPNKLKKEPDLQLQRAVDMPDQQKCHDSENRSTMFRQQEEEAVEGSSVAKKAQAKLHNKEIQDRALDIEARVEDTILRNILLLDEDGSKTHRKANLNRTIRTDNVQNVTIIVDEICSIPSAHNRKISKNPISILVNEDQMQVNNSRAQESSTVDRHLLILPPNCPQLNISHTERLDVSFTHCKKEQVHTEKICEDVRDSYGEMPILENVYFKEEMPPLNACKDKDQSDHSEQMQDKEDEMIGEDDGNRCINQKSEEDDDLKETENPHVSKGELTVTEAAAEDLSPAATEDKPFTCEFCGRNLMNSSELKRHILRHGL